MKGSEISPHPSALIPRSNGTTDIMAGSRQRARRHLGRRARIILFARAASAHVSVRGLFRRARSVRAHADGTEAALRAGVVRVEQRDADRQLRAPAEVGR